MLQHILGRRAFAIAVAFAFVAATGIPAGAQQDDAVAHAKRVLDLLGQDKFEDVAQQFNAQMAVALPPQQLATTWTMLRQQARRPPFRATFAASPAARRAAGLEPLHGRIHHGRCR
jgi:hypothetical protein